MIQATIKGYVTRAQYTRFRGSRKDRAVLRIQTAFRTFLARKDFLIKKSAIMKAQANVLTR